MNDQDSKCAPTEVCDPNGCLLTTGCDYGPPFDEFYIVNEKEIQKELNQYN